MREIRARGIATVIDLRSRDEIAYTGYGRLTDSGARVVEAADVDGSPPEADRAMVVETTHLDDVYWNYLTVGAPLFVRAFAELGRRETYPAVVSCFFGKDRTGVLVAMVLSCLGVETEAIVADYALSASQMDATVERLRRDSVYRETLDQTPTWRLSARPATMRSLLQRVDSHFGGAREWALRSGVSTAHLEGLQSALLE